MLVHSHLEERSVPTQKLGAAAEKPHETGRKFWPPSSVISLSSQSNFMVCAALALPSASMYNKNTVLSFRCHDLQLHTMHGYVIVVSSFWEVWLNLLNPSGYGPAIFYASAKVASMKHGFLANLITYNTSYHQLPPVTQAYCQYP